MKSFFEGYCLLIINLRTLRKIVCVRSVYIMRSLRRKTNLPLWSIVLYERMGLSQHPVPIRQVPCWANTRFRIVLNNFTHVERRHDIVMPYSLVIETSTLADIGKVHCPWKLWVTKGTICVLFSAVGHTWWRITRRFSSWCKSGQSRKGCRKYRSPSSL